MLSRLTVTAAICPIRLDTTNVDVQNFIFAFETQMQLQAEWLVQVERRDRQDLSALLPRAIHPMQEAQAKGLQMKCP
jgi:hypothetical protein